MSVTANPESSEMETSTARISCLWCDDAFLQESERLARLEGRTRRVLSHDCAVEKRFVRVLSEQFLTLSSLTTNHDARVVSRVRHHTKHFACAGFYRYDAAKFAFHQAFSKGLQLNIDAHRQVSTRNGSFVELAVLVASLNSSTSIAQKNFHSFLASQSSFVRAFNAKFADIVAASIVIVGLNISWTHLCNVAKKVGCVGIGVLSDASLLNVKAWKAEKLLLKTAELLCGELTHEELLCIGTIARIALQVFYLRHSPLVPIGCDAETFAKIECVDALLLVHDDHHIVGRLIVDEQFAVAVGDCASGRILNALEESVGVGALLEVLAQQLQREKPQQINKNDDNCSATNHVFALCKLVISLHSATYF